MPVLQSLAQARNKWGDHAATTIWDASIVKVILGGASASKDLQELSVLIGERDERSHTVGIGDYGARSLHRSRRSMAAMPSERIRTLPLAQGSSCYEALRPSLRVFVPGPVDSRANFTPPTKTYPDRAPSPGTKPDGCCTTRRQRDGYPIDTTEEPDSYRGAGEQRQWRQTSPPKARS